MRPTIILAVAGSLAGTAFACRQQSISESPSAQTVDDKRPAPAPIARIEPGTRIQVAEMPPLTRLVFRSRPQITSGDVGKVAKSIADAMQTFRTFVLVQAEPDQAQPGRFRRGPFSIGIGMPDQDDEVILTKASASRLGLSLGFFEGKVLTEREKELTTVLSPGSTPTMAIFDFTATYLRDGVRVPVVLRYFAIVDPSNGNIETVYCLLDSTPDGYRFFGDSVWLLPPNHTMDWEMHVDGGKISFGAPKADAFAVTKLPQGTAIAVPAEFEAAATARAFTAEASASLEQQVRDVLKNRPR